MDGLDIVEVLRRVAKYLIMGVVVALAAHLIPRKGLAASEILMVALCAAAVFALLDLYAPSISAGARAGAGLAIGANLVGGF